jgi:serine/threonine protein kinase
MNTGAPPSTAPVLSRGGEFAAGDMLGDRYRLAHRLGRGGFGDVWRAEELLPDGSSFREVALKLLAASVARSGRWGDEAKLLASVRHPSLVTVYAAGLLDTPAGRVPFVSMELLEGETLAELVAREGRVGWRRALRLGREAAAALDAIHVLGIVHLDLKPANLFLTRAGQLKVLDFGISRRSADARPVEVHVRVERPDADPLEAEQARAARARRTALAATTMQGGGVVGTPGFIAPELLRGETPTHAADAYSLAVSLAELLIGELPYAVAPPADTADVLPWWERLRAAALQGSLRDLGADPRRVPLGVSSLLSRLLSTEPAARAVGVGGLAALFHHAERVPFGPPADLYPGLAPLGPEHEGCLVGRDADVGRLVRHLHDDGWVALVGERGVGKASVARAGVVPGLAREAIDGREEWRAVWVPHGTPLVHALATAGLPTSLDGLLGLPRSEGLALVVQGVAARGDEAEELDALLDALSVSPPIRGLRALVLTDDDELTRLGSERSTRLRLRARALGRLGTSHARDLVAAPLELRGDTRAIPEELVATVRAELAAGHLPMVSLALAEAARAAKGQSIAEGWRAAGGVPGAVTRLAERTLRAAPPALKAVATRALLLLGTSSAEREPYEPEELLAACSNHPAEAARALEFLVRAQLVRVGNTARLGHPALARAGGSLGTERLSHAAELAAIELVRDASRSWQRSERSPEQLLTPTQLAAFERAAAGAPLGSFEREFLRESRHRRRRTRGRRALAATLAFAALLTAAVFQRSAESRRQGAERAQLQAERIARISDAIAQARRATDPYHQAAWLEEALSQGSTDPSLALELTTALFHLPRARFLTLGSTRRPLPLGQGRWVVAHGPGELVTAVDLAPPSPERDDEPIERPTFDDFAPPIPTELDLGGSVVELQSLSFDDAFAARLASGDVVIVRAEGASAYAEAARLELGCRGPLHTATKAPVLACASERGVTYADLRDGAQSRTLSSELELHAISEDGYYIATSTLDGALHLWALDGLERTFRVAAPGLRAAAFGPGGSTLAIVVEPPPAEPSSAAPRRAPPIELRVLDLESGRVVFERPIDEAPTSIDWDPNGLDLGLCGPTADERVYLRHGRRAPLDPLPSPDLCRRPSYVRASDDVGRLDLRVSKRGKLESALRLGPHRLLTQDLTLFDERAGEAGVVFEPRSSSGAPERASEQGLASVVWTSHVVAVDMGGEVAAYSSASGRKTHEEPGKLVGVCRVGATGKMAVVARREEAPEGGGRSRDDTIVYEVVDAEHGGVVGLGTGPKGLLLAIDDACSALVVQTLGGEVLALPLDLREPVPLGHVKGYLYEARSSLDGRAIWMVASSGEVFRLDVSGPPSRWALRAVATASLARAIEPAQGGAYVLDERGVWWMSEGGATRLLTPLDHGAGWRDLRLGPSMRSLVLSGLHRTSVVGLDEGKVLASHPIPLGDRLARWGEEGLLLAFPGEQAAPPKGIVLLVDPDAASRAARSVSNLRVERGTLTLGR